MLACLVIVAVSSLSLWQVYSYVRMVYPLLMECDRWLLDLKFRRARIIQTEKMSVLGDDVSLKI
jgi:hypothetical protein